MMFIIPTVLFLNSVSPQDHFKIEAERLTTATIAEFYDSSSKIWKPPVISTEAVGKSGYTFWPSLLAWQAVIEAAKVEPREWKPKIAHYYDSLEQYFDKEGHAYCAWIYFPGNDDKFYDDNTWAAIACMEAFQVTGESRYKERAVEIFEKFVKGGWDDSGNPGGLRWGTKAGLEDRGDKTISATAAGALAALLIAREQDTAADQAWAKRALDWIHDKLSTNDGLIYDGFKAPKFTRMPTIWSYNTGVPIRAAVEYAEQTNDQHYRDWAIKMGDACLNRSLSPMFDGSVTDPSKRYWYDSTFFVQYLVDGMRILSKDTKNRKYIDEARREADYCMTNLKDSDGFYWRNMRMWKINSDRESAFIKYSGQSAPTLDPDASERSQEPSAMALPVDQRPMVKTLLANGSTARMFWMLAH